MSNHVVEGNTVSERYLVPKVLELCGNATIFICISIQCINMALITMEEGADLEDAPLGVEIKPLVMDHERW